MAENKFEKELFSQRVIDNRNISMTDALKYLLKQPEFRTLDVAVGYFYISGLLLVKDEFIDFMEKRNGRFRILMGNETNGATVNVLDKTKFDNYTQYIHATTANDTSKISDKEFLGKVSSWISDKRIEVKVYRGELTIFMLRVISLLQALILIEGQQSLALQISQKQVFKEIPS